MKQTGVVEEAPAKLKRPNKQPYLLTRAIKVYSLCACLARLALPAGIEAARLTS